MSGIRRNAPCPCGSGKKYKHCCYEKGFIKVPPDRKAAHFSLDDNSKISRQITSLDSVPTHNQNGITPNITAEQIMDLCLDEINNILAAEQVGMTHDLIDDVILKMDIVPTFTYRQILDRMLKDNRFEVAHGQICSLKGTDPLELMAEKLGQ